MKLRIAACAAAALLAVLPSSAGAQPQGELRIAIPWTPENLDPTMNLSSIRAMVGVTMFDSLVGRDADNRIVPQLAESWRLVDDTTWQLKLRRGVVFHDDEPFNAEAVRFTFQRVLDPEQKSPNRANMAEIARWCAEGKLSAHVHAVYPLEQTAEAIKALSNRQAMGKLVLRP